MMNKSKGDMYGFVSHTWNAIKGKCSHDCDYCYMKVFPQKEIHLDEKELKIDLGKGNIIFVGSSTDMFANDVPEEWIKKVLEYCKTFDNTYLFQSKNPKRFLYFNFPERTILGTTIETNRKYEKQKCPSVQERQHWIGEVEYPIFLTVEPVMDFDLDIMVNWIKDINPQFVNIGADSKGHYLDEKGLTKNKIELFIKELQKFTKVNMKDNLKRLM